MRFPRWTMRRVVIVMTLVTVFLVVGCWAWTKSTLRLELELGPGARLSASISSNLLPRVEPASLPSVRSIADDAPYFPPGPDFPWSNTQEATARAVEQARQKVQEDR